MKKKVLKTVMVAMMVCSLGVSLAGCSKKTECDGCGEVKKCKEYNVLGEKIMLCGDCADELGVD